MGVNVIYHFDALSYATARRELRRNGVPVPAGDRALDVLACLLRHPGQPVSLPELLRAGWGERTVSDNNVSVQMAALRRVLGTTADGSPFIRTVAGRGYILQVDVRRTDAPDGKGVPASAIPAHAAALATSSFVGRTRETATVATLLAGERLVTVTGMGGIGKTRLVEEVLRRGLPGCEDGVHTVDLTAVTAPDRLIQAVAATVGHVDATEPALVARFRDRAVLLVLDNAEHLAEAVGRLLPGLLAQCPRLRALVTSRQLLRIPEERVLRLRPLPVPDTRQADAQAMLAFDCVRLFVDRAAAAVPGFQLADQDAPTVAEICRRLDGIALAVEMVVPRLRVMSLAEIAERLTERFRMLGPARAGVASRQRTLLTMMQWSWELLDAAEQDTLRRIAVFQRPATLSLLCGLGEPGLNPDWPLLDALEGLAVKSLVTPERSDSTTVYGLLQTTRDFVLTQTSATDLEALRARHALQMATQLEQARDAWDTMPGPDWFARYGAIADDLRAALDWAERPDGDPALCVRLLAASIPLWWELPGVPIRSTRAQFDRIAGHLPPAMAPLHLAWFHVGQSWRAVHLGDAENRPTAELAVAAARRAGHPVALGAALLRLGTTLLRAETLADAAATLAEAEAELRRVAPGKWLALTLGRKADLAVRQGALPASLPLYEEAHDLARALHYRYGLATIVSNLTEVLFTLDDRPGALARLTALRQDLPPGLRSGAVATLAAHLAADGQLRPALEAVAEVLAWVPATGFVGPLGFTAEVVGLLLAQEGRLATAATLAGFARQVLPSGATRFGSRKFVFDALDQRLRTGLPRADLDRTLDAGAAWTLAVAETALRVECRSLADRSAAS